VQELRELANGELIGNFVEDPPYGLSIENVSGVSLRIDEYWLAWNRARPLAFGLPPFEPIPQRTSRTFLGARYDFNDRPPDWDSYCTRKGYFGAGALTYMTTVHPVLVVVILRRPLGEIFQKGDFPRHVGPHPIVYDHRPDAEAYALRSGDFLGAEAEGTLGGFLWNKRDGAYNAVSCAHVLGKESVGGSRNRAYSPKPGALGGKVEIGDVIWSEMPKAVSSTKCNSRTDPNAPTIDAACVVMDSTVTPNLASSWSGKITQHTPIAHMGQGDAASFYGNVSKHVRAKIKEVTIWKEIKVGKTSYCFKDIFVLEDTIFHYVAADLAKKGDSGAWVVNTSAGFASWDGMLVGGDGQNAYCCYAENIMNAMPDKDLILPP
jgi:hypothetical protein